jgi:translation initiation factor 2 subunit 3
VQPEINIGLVGHVDHGKTTLTEQLSGKWTDTHSEELKRGITIRLGYADAEIRAVTGSEGIEKYTVKQEVDGKKTELLRKISLIDAPGHESLMATMIAGASLMDGALLMVSATESVPQPQTVEHLMALEMSGIDNVIVVQNKIDTVSKERAIQNYNQIKEFLKDTKFKDAPVVPISALQGVNIDALIAAIQEYIPTPKRDESAGAQLYVARSFDTNKPGTQPEKLKGGVLGGAVVSGKISVGDTIEIRPGRIVQEANKLVAHPITTTVTSVVSGGDVLKELGPGGSSGIMTELDPAIVASDSLTGSIAGAPDKLPPIWYVIELDTTLLERMVGMQGAEGTVHPLKSGELLLLNVHSSTTAGQVIDLGKNRATLALRMPICAQEGARITISRKVGTRFRLIGYGMLSGGKNEPQ